MGFSTTLISVLIAVGGYLYVSLKLPAAVMEHKARAFVAHLNDYDVDGAAGFMAADVTAAIGWNGPEDIVGRDNFAAKLGELRDVTSAVHYFEEETICSGHHCEMVCQQAYQIAEADQIVGRPWALHRTVYLYFQFNRELQIAVFAEHADLPAQTNRTRMIATVDSMARAMAAGAVDDMVSYFASDALVVEGDRLCDVDKCLRVESQAFADVQLRWAERFYEHAVAGPFVFARELGWTDLNTAAAVDAPELRDHAMHKLPRYAISRGLHLFKLNERFEIELWLSHNTYNGPASSVMDSSPRAQPSRLPTALTGSGWELGEDGEPASWW